MATEKLRVEIEAYTEGYKQGLRDAWEETEQFERKIDSSSKNIQKNSKQIGGAASVFIGSMAVKAIGALIQAGIKGMDTMYQFSAATGGQFQQTMDSVYSSFQNVKTALGSTFATVLTALAPAINQICSLVLTAANALSFFFAMLSGQSGYTRAVATTASYGAAAANSLGSAAGSAEKLRKSLLGIDEINALNDPNSGGGGGGGGGGAGGSGLDGLEYVEFEGIAKDISTVMGKIKKAVEKHIGDVAGLVKNAFKAFGALLNGSEQEFQEALNAMFKIVSENQIFRWLHNAVADIWAFFDNFFYGIQDGWMDFKIDVVTGWGEICALFNNGKVPEGIQKTIDKLKEEKETLKQNHEKTQDLIAAFKESGNVGFDLTQAGLWGVYNAAKSAATEAAQLAAAVQFISNMAVHPITVGINVVKSALAGFASGGFPDEGSLFVAREAGPEMVGTIGGRTAVANNNDIVAAVSEGVFEAVSQAMSGNGSSSNTEIAVYMDSEIVARAADRGNKALNRRFSVNLV